MTPPNAGAVKMVRVEASAFEAVGYVPVSRQLYIKFKTMPAMCFDNVPGFRFDGLMAAPRKDAYFKSFIENKFMTKTVNLP
jgi:hypothetical protein